MYKNQTGNLPDIFQNMFEINSNIHEYPTRHRSQLRPPKYKLRCTERTIRVQGVKIWNVLSCKISSDCSMVSFKKHIKLFLLESGLVF